MYAGQQKIDVLNSCCIFSILRVGAQLKKDQFDCFFVFFFFNLVFSANLEFV